jgi:hypothetical protein
MTLFSNRAKGLALAIAVLLCAVPGVGRAQSAAGQALACKPFVPADSGYEFSRNQRQLPQQRQALRFGEIHLTRLPIFDESDPEEDIALFRWANDFHRLTRPQVIRQQLLFAEGEPFDARLMAETARLLRQQAYFHDADIRAVSVCNETVDVEVISKDNWSLTPSLSFDRQGGDNTYSIGLRDSNFLGYGKLLALSDGKDIDRHSSELMYQDPNLLGSRLRADVNLENSNDGDSRAASLDLPFYSLDSRRAWALRLKDEERLDTQYFRSEEISEVRHHEEMAVAELGFSAGLINGWARRWQFGLQYQQNRYQPGSELPTPPELPRDRKLIYPFAALEFVEDDYVTAFNLDQIYRTEDLHLGRELRLRLGYAAETFGSDQDRLVFDGHYSNSLHYDDDSLWQHQADWEGFYNFNSRALENVLLSYQNRYFRRQTAQRSFFARLEAVYSKNLDPHRQVVLGGQTGARAFENRYQVGDSRVLLSLEERLYSDIHLLNLIRLGAAVFVDAGRVWSDVETGSREDWLADIGFGLRLASSKAASDRIAHLDFAFPLTNQSDPAVDSVLVSFTVKGSF